MPSQIREQPRDDTWHLFHALLYSFSQQKLISVSRRSFALQVAERRYNQALFARLRLKGDTAAPNGGVFCVGTYHMPCMFMIPAVMTIHTSMAIKHLTKLAGADPLVFGGDFNFTPDSECYKLATQGELTVASRNSRSCLLYT